MDRTELLKSIHDGRAELEAVLGRFDDSALTQPLLPNGWSVKDVIAHVGFWERRIATLYEILKAGDVPKDTVSDETVDALNGRIYDENLALPMDVVRSNEAEGYRALLAVAESAPEADLFDPQRFPWTQGTPFHRFIAENTFEHYADHLPDLLSVEL